MGKVYIGINLEFVRHADKPFEWAVEKAAELGYEYIEPWVHWGREAYRPHSRTRCFSQKPPPANLVISFHNPTPSCQLFYYPYLPYE